MRWRPPESAVSWDGKRCCWCSAPRAKWAACTDPECSVRPPEPPKFTYGEMRAEMERELRRRKRVAPNRLLTGRRKDTVMRELRILEAVIEVLRELEKSELLVAF